MFSQAVAGNESESRKEWMLYLFKFFANNSKQNKENMFWQKTSHLVEINNNELFEQKRNYIHNNPLAAGIVSDEMYYTHSSANPNCQLKVDEY